MSELTAQAITTADLERRVRSALATRLRNGRVPDAPEWDDECVAAIIEAANAHAVGYARECVAAIETAATGSVTVPAGTGAADAADALVASEAAGAAKATAPKLPRRTKAATGAQS